MSDKSSIEEATTAELVAELERRSALPRCRCKKWQTYLGVWDSDGYTLRCYGCLRAIAGCTCG